MASKAELKKWYPLACAYTLHRDNIEVRYSTGKEDWTIGNLVDVPDFAPLKFAVRRTSGGYYFGVFCDSKSHPFISLCFDTSKHAAIVCGLHNAILTKFDTAEKLLAAANKKAASG